MVILLLFGCECFAAASGELARLECECFEAVALVVVVLAAVSCAELAAGDVERLALACVTGGGDWNDAVVGTKGKLDHHSDHCGYFPDQTTADCHIDDDTGWQVARMRSVALLLQGSNARGVVTLDGIRVPWVGFYRIQGTVV